MIKRCSKCGKEDLAETFHGLRCKNCRRKYRQEWRVRSKEWLKDYRRTHSREQDIARAVKWNKENPDKHRQFSLEYYYRLQDATIQAYGGYKCACCGETEPFFLTLDHVNNNGSQDRKKHGFFHHGAKFYKWLKEHNYPSGYQVLCSNCNHGKHRNHGICPHQKA